MPSIHPVYLAASNVLSYPITAWTGSMLAPTLLLDNPTPIDLETGDETVYKIENIPGERTLVATLSVNGVVVYHDLFLRHRKPPTGYDYDAFSQKALSSNQTAVVRNTRAGTYYLRI